MQRIATGRVSEPSGRTLVLSAILVLLLVLSSTQYIAGGRGDASEAPVRPLVEDLNFTNPPPLNISSDIAYHVSLHPLLFEQFGPYVGWAQITLLVPLGFVSLGNDTVWEGNLTLDSYSTSFVWTLRSVQTGNWTVMTRIIFNYTVPRLNQSDPRYAGSIISGASVTIHVGTTSAWIIDTSYQQPPTPPGYNETTLILENTTYTNGSHATPCLEGGILTPCPVSNAGPGSAPPGPGPLAGKITVVGKIDFNDPELGMRPARWLTVEVYDVNFLVDFLLDVTMTDSDGYFESKEIDNSDELGSKDIYIKAFTHNTAARVHGEWGAIHAAKSETKWDVPDGEVNFGWLVPGQDGKAGGFRVFEYLMDGWNYMANGPASWIPDKVSATWQSGHDAQYGCWPCSPTSHYHLSGVLCEKQIHLDSPASDSPDVVLHEYGHFVMHNAYGWWYDPDWLVGGHSLDQLMHRDGAWVEGWPNFFGTAVRGDEWYSDYGEDQRFNLETGALETISNPVWDWRKYYWGDARDTAIGNSLYDLSDPDDDDAFDGSFDMVWNIIESQTDSNFAEFWSAWKDYYSADNHVVHYAKVAIYQNLIDYNTAPYTRDMRIVSPSPSGYYSGEVTFDASFDDLEDEDDYYLTMRFQYYDLPTDTWITFDELYGEPPGYKYGYWDTTTVPDGDYVYRSWVFDDMESEAHVPSPNDIHIDNTLPVSSVDLLPTYETSMSFTVSWTGTDPGTDPSGIDYYDIQYKDKDGADIWIDWLLGTMVNQATFNAADEHMYCFQSRVVDRAGNVEDYPGGDGDTCTTVDATPPVEPTGLAVTNPLTGNRLDLDWDDNPEPDLDHYDVEWKLQPGSWPGNRISPIYPSQYTHLGLTDGTTYCYRIIAVDTRGRESPPGPSAGECDTPTDEIPPNIIGDLSATAGPGAGEITLMWTAPGDSSTDGTASQYDIRWSDVGPVDSWAAWNAANQITDEPVPSPSGSAESYTFDCPDCDVTYWFNIRAGDEVPNWADPHFLNSPSAVCPYGEVTTFWYGGVEYSTYDLQFGDDGGSETIYVELLGDAIVDIAQLDLTGQTGTLTYFNSFVSSLDADPGTDYHVVVYNGAAELEHIPEDALEAEQTETDYGWDLENHYKIAQSFQFTHSKLTKVELYLDLCRVGGDFCEGSLTVTVHIQEQLDCEIGEPCWLGTDSQSIPTPFEGWRTFTFNIDGLSPGKYYVVVDGYCGPGGDCPHIQICFWCDVKGGTGNPYPGGVAHLYPPGQGWYADPDKDLAFRIYYEGYGYFTEGHFEKTITRTTYVELAFLNMDQTSPPGTQIETFYWNYASSQWVSLGTGDKTNVPLPPDPSGHSVRVRFEFSGTESSTPRMWEYSISTNHLPSNAVIDIGDDAGNWFMSGTFDYTVTIDETNTFPLFISSLEDFLFGKSGMVMVPITIHSDTAGTICVSNLYIKYRPN